MAITTDSRYINILLKIAKANSDDTAIAALAELKVGLDKIKSVSDVSAEAVTRVSNALSSVQANPHILEFASDLDTATAAMKSAEAQLKELNTEFKLAQGLSAENNFNIGYGVPGGGIGPAVAPTVIPDDGSGGGGGGIGYGVGRGLRAAGSLATIAGASPGVGKGFQAAADFAYISKAVDQVSESFQQLPGLLGDMAAGGAAIAGSLGAVLAVAIPVALAIAAVTLAFKAFEDQANRSAIAEKARYENTQTLIAQLEDDRKNAKTLSPAQAQADLDAIEQKRQDQINLLEQQKAERAQTDAQYTALGSSLNPGERARLKALGDQQDTDIATTIDNISKLNGAFQNYTMTLIPMVDEQSKLNSAAAEALKGSQDKIASEERLAGLADGTSAAAKKRVDMLEAQDKAINDQIPSLQEQAKTNKAAQTAIDGYTATLQQNKQDIDALNNTIIPAIQAREEEAAAMKEQIAYEKRLTAERKSAQAQVASIENTLAGMRLTQQQTLAKQALDDKQAADAEQARKDNITRKADEANAHALETYNDNVDKTNRTFDDSQLKAQQDFQKQYLRNQQDLTNTLNDLAGQRDVAGFIKAQRDGEVKLQREQQDFAASRALAQRNHQQTLFDMETAYQRERRFRDQATQDSLNQQRQSNDARQQLEIDDYNQRYAVEEQKLTEAKARLDRFWAEVNSTFEMAHPSTPVASSPGSAPARQDAPAPGGGGGGGALSGGQIVQDIAIRAATGIGNIWNFLTGIPKYETGLDFATTRHMAIIDKGEGVLTAKQNRMAGGSGGAIQISIGSIGGDITQAHLNNLEHSIYTGVSKGLKAHANGF